MPTPSTSSAGASKSLGERTRVVRWCIAVGLVVVGFSFLFISNPTICEDAVADSGAQTIRLCRTPEITDSYFWGPAVLVILLFLPDISEVTVAGMTLRRDLSVHGQRVDVIERRLVEMQAAIASAESVADAASSAAARVESRADQRQEISIALHGLDSQVYLTKREISRKIVMPGEVGEDSWESGQNA